MWPILCRCSSRRPAALAGTILGLWGQSRAQVAAAGQWRAEQADRDRTRFHDQRLATYTEFVELASNAFGVLLDGAIQKQTRAERPPSTSELAKLFETTPRRLPTTALMRLDHPEFGQDAPMRMTRAASRVLMLTRSDDVKEAANHLVHATLAIAQVEARPEDSVGWN